MAEKLSSLDEGYTIGDLSVYPEAVDTLTELYIVRNNAETTLKQSLGYNAKKIIVEDASQFPLVGILKLGPPPGEVGSFELVYYGQRTNSVFSDLIRGFAGSRQAPWQRGDYCIHGVHAEQHDIVRDSVYNIERNLGTEEFPTETSLNGILKALENKWLAPRILFRAAPTRFGPPPLTVRFQNFSLNHIIRYLWDFGDGVQSGERSPTHTYTAEGSYTVRLEVITTEGATSVMTKTNYILVDNDQVTPFFYVLPIGTTSLGYSIQTASELGISPTVFEFVDQTDGEITERFWVFGDGTNSTVADPNEHSETHIYELPGEYDPSLLLVLASGVPKRGFAEQKVTVL
jgi:hypothetical protein